MAADAWTFLRPFALRLGDGTHDLDTHTLKCILLTSSWTPDTENDAVLADISANEVSGNGYARQTLSSVLWTRSTTVVTLDADDVEFTASGGSIVARYAAIFNDSPTSPADPLICYSLLDNTPANVTVTDGNTLRLRMNASGIFTLTIS